VGNELDAPSPWNATLAATLPGKLLLVGLTYLDADGALIDKQQFFGRVMTATPRAGILLLLEGRRGGERYALPPDTRSFRRAKPGEYRLQATGEVVINPDYTVTFSIRKRPDHASATIH